MNEEEWIDIDKEAKLFINLSPCPPGWTTDPAHSARLAKLAVDTGICALKEAIMVM